MKTALVLLTAALFLTPVASARSESVDYVGGADLGFCVLDDLVAAAQGVSSACFEPAAGETSVTISVVDDITGADVGYYVAAFDAAGNTVDDAFGCGADVTISVAGATDVIVYLDDPAFALIICLTAAVATTGTITATFS